MTAGGGGGGGEQNELIPEGLTYLYKCNIDIKKMHYLPDTIYIVSFNQNC